MRAATLLLGLAIASACRSPAPARPADGAVAPATERVVSAEELVRTRCDLDGRQVVTTWAGAVYAVVPGEPVRHVFDTLGMNVARCLEHRGRWHLTSRELMYYLAPETGRPLERWRNPWTDEHVAVVHVANRLVQAPLGGGSPLHVVDGLATLIVDVPLFYPDPLAAELATRPFSVGDNYQAIELFALQAPAAAVSNADLSSVPTLTLSWHREGPWLPWMKQGARPGRLLYRAHGRKVASVQMLDPLLQRELRERVPLFLDAPRCVVADRNETSWTYFARNLPAYLAGARFPLPAAPDPTECGASATSGRGGQRSQR